MKPVAGGFEGDLPGTGFSVVLLASKEQGDTIDFVGVACSPDRQFAGAPVTVDEAVPIDDGKFNARSSDVAIDGQFASPVEARGTIRGLSEDAKACGVPVQARWASECHLDVAAEAEKTAPGGLAIGSSYATAEGGTVFGHLEVVTGEGKRRLEATRTKSGKCGSTKAP